jgi:hypothetical protein
MHNNCQSDAGSGVRLATGGLQNARNSITVEEQSRPSPDFLRAFTGVTRLHPGLIRSLGPKAHLSGPEHSHAPLRDRVRPRPVVVLPNLVGLQDRVVRSRVCIGHLEYSTGHNCTCQAYWRVYIPPQAMSIMTSRTPADLQDHSKVSGEGHGRLQVRRQ